MKKLEKLRAVKISTKNKTVYARTVIQGEINQILRSLSEKIPPLILKKNSILKENSVVE